MKTPLLNSEQRQIMREKPKSQSAEGWALYLAFLHLHKEITITLEPLGNLIVELLNKRK